MTRLPPLSTLFPFTTLFRSAVIDVLKTFPGPGNRLVIGGHGEFQALLACGDFLQQPIAAFTEPGRQAGARGAGKQNQSAWLWTSVAAQIFERHGYAHAPAGQDERPVELSSYLREIPAEGFQSVVLGGLPAQGVTPSAQVGADEVGLCRTGLG